jgi:hypothetical protein
MRRPDTICSKFLQDATDGVIHGHYHLCLLRALAHQRLHGCCRKYLHDDITVSVVVLGTEGSRYPST